MIDSVIVFDIKFLFCIWLLNIFWVSGIKNVVFINLYIIFGILVNILINDLIRLVNLFWGVSLCK